MTLGALAWVARRLIRFFLGLALLSVLSIAVAGDRDDEAYEQAQAAIQAENWQDAIARLEAIRHEYPHHAGALVDLAILYCNIGNAAKTDAALDTLEGVFELPSALAPLIRELRLRPCPRADASTHWSAIFTVGRETNANQGSAQRSFSFGDSNSPFYVTLDDEFLPRASAFAAVQLQVSSKTNNQDRLYGALYARRYASVEEFDDALALIGYERSVSDAPWASLSDVSATLRTLGGRLYQQTLSARIQSAPPRAQQASFMFSLEAQATYVHYPTRAAFDNWETAISTRMLWQLSTKTSVHASAGWLFDIALNSRPGGNRTGPSVAIDWLHRPAYDWQVYASWKARILQGETPYAPPLLTMTQRQRRQTLAAGWERRLSRESSIRMEYQHSQNLDTIPLHRFNSESVVLYWIREGVR